MQKVEGSSPFIRFNRKPRPGGAFGVHGGIVGTRAGAGSTSGEYQTGPAALRSKTLAPFLDP
jgi:hypothetical protein